MYPVSDPFPLTFNELRHKNAERCKLWHPGGVNDWSLSDWGVAMAGEAGEALNVIKKLNRERDGLVGNTQKQAELEAALGEELADVAIYLDLLAQRAGVNLAQAIIDKFNKVSVKNGFPTRL